MDVSSVKRRSERVKVVYNSTLNIKSYGKNNLYPQEVSDIINASSTGVTCLNRYARFIEGNGFRDLEFAKTIINRTDETADDICSKMAQDIARYGGFALHVNYNILCQVVEVQHIPFEMCRLEEDDDAGYISHIAIHPDWAQRKTRNKKVLRVNKDNVDYIDVFNPGAVSSQIASVGGIENYRGQVLYVTFAGRDVYTETKYDSALSDISTDEGLSNVKYRNVRNNFLPAGMLVTFDGQMAPGDEKSNGYADSLKDFQGDEQALSFISVNVANESEKPQFVEFPIKNFDKEFEVTEKSVEKRIYSVFEQEEFYKSANMSASLSDADKSSMYKSYSAVCNRERRMIERWVERVFSMWAEPINPSGDYSVQPLSFDVADGDNSNQG